MRAEQKIAESARSSIRDLNAKPKILLALPELDNSQEAIERMENAYIRGCKKCSLDWRPTP